MDKSYHELLQDREILDAKIAEMRKQEIESAIAEVRRLVNEFDLTERDVFRGMASAAKPRSKVAPKYRDPATGKTWTGRGKPPAWIADQDRSRFAIDQAA